MAFFYLNRFFDLNKYIFSFLYILLVSALGVSPHPHPRPRLHCSWSNSFSGEPSPGSSLRYVETQSMQIGASYSLQVSLVMGCGRQPSPHIDTQVRLEFSTNHGLTWHLVKEVRKHCFRVDG